MQFPGQFVFFLLLTVKYCILPILVLTGVSYHENTDTSIAGMLMYLYEEICIMTVMGILLQKKRQDFYREPDELMAEKIVQHHFLY